MKFIEANQYYVEVDGQTEPNYAAKAVAVGKAQARVWEEKTHCTRKRKKSPTQQLHMNASTLKQICTGLLCKGQPTWILEGVHTVNSIC